MHKIFPWGELSLELKEIWEYTSFSNISFKYILEANLLLLQINSL